MANKEVKRITKEIINIIQKLSGTYTTYDIFYDWVKMFALSISNTTDFIQDDVWQDREKTYMECIRKHDMKTIDGFCRMSGFLVDALDMEITDVLTDDLSEEDLAIAHKKYVI